MQVFHYSIKIIEILSNVFTIGVSLIALFVFFFKKEEIKSVIDVLLGYSFQISLSELHSKLDRLNALNADDDKHRIEAINIFNEIEGQVSGNHYLKAKCAEILVKVGKAISKPANMTDARKRNLVSELRENLRNTNVKNYDMILRRGK